MNTHSPRDGIDCYLVVPAQYRPQLYTDIAFLNGNNLRAQVTFTERSNENRIEKADGSMDIYKLGDVRRDLSLKIVGSDPETERVLDEIIRRNIPVYVYPRAGGNLQLNAPLVRGVQTDPLDKATLTFTTSVGATVYMPRADAGHGIYLEALDTTAPLIDGTYTANGAQTQLPMGRGMPFMREHKNLLKRSLMSEITHEAPYTAGAEWGAYTSAADVWGTDHGIRQSIWCADANSYWTKSTTTRLRSYDFNITGGITSNLSFCYRINGSMLIELKDASGVTKWSKAISTGSGRAQKTVVSTASIVGAYLEITLASGSFYEVSCMQLLSNASIAITEYQPFLGTESPTVEAEITGNDLTIDVDMGADLHAYTTTPADRDGAVIASGYLQPQMTDNYELQGSVFCSMVGYDASFSAYIGDNGSGALVFGLQTDKTSRDTATITGHEIGDVYAWGLWSGYTDGTAATRLYIVRLRDDAEYACNYAKAIMFPYRVVIGADEDGDYQADSVLSAVTVEAIHWNDGATVVDRLADCSILNVARSTIGRWYRISKNTSPKRYKSDANAGTYTGTEVRAI